MSPDSQREAVARWLYENLNTELFGYPWDSKHVTHVPWLTRADELLALLGAGPAEPGEEAIKRLEEEIAYLESESKVAAPKRFQEVLAGVAARLSATHDMLASEEGSAR